MRGRITVEQKLGSALRTTQRFGYPDYPANTTYNRLQPADVHLGDKWLTVGNVLKDLPPDPHVQHMFLHPAIDEYGDKHCDQKRTRRHVSSQLLPTKRPSYPQTAQSKADMGP